jgi:hypothetical protein
MDHMRLEVTEGALARLFNAFRDSAEFKEKGVRSFGRFRVDWDLAAHLENGSFTLDDPGSPGDGFFRVKELDIKWHKLRLGFGLDIPRVCVGGYCVIPTPWGCALRLPRKCFFESNPDISATVNLDNVLTQEISLEGGFDLKHDVPRPGAWRVHLNPRTVDIDLIDIADTVGDLIDNLIDKFVNSVLSPLPDWARDVVKAVLGNLSRLIRGILDIGDDIAEWLSHLLGVSLGLFNLIVQLVADYFAEKKPLHRLPDPYPLLPAKGSLPAVFVPIDRLGASIFDDKAVLTAELGA